MCVSRKAEEVAMAGGASAGTKRGIDELQTDDKNSDEINKINRRD